jgi:hypothetical protein
MRLSSQPKGLCKETRHFGWIWRQSYCNVMGKAVKGPVSRAFTARRRSYNRDVPDSPKSIAVYSWRIFERRKKRWRELSWMMDDATAAR